MNIDWLKFDKIYCIHYLPYEERLQNLKRELDRIGILNSPNFEFYYTNKSTVYDYLYESMLEHGIIFNKENVLKNDGIEFNFINAGTFNLAINYLNLFKICDYSQYENVLFLEDDITFLKDESLLKKYIDNIPNSYQIINFDTWFKKQNYDKKSLECINEYYSYVPRQFGFCNGTSCYALNRKAIKYIINAQETFLKTSDCYLNEFHICLGLEHRLIVPNENICIQKNTYCESLNHINRKQGQIENQSVNWRYRQIDLDKNKYQ